MAKNALLLGATGLVGSTLLPQLLSSPLYEAITILVRRASHIEHPKLHQFIIDFEDFLSCPLKFESHFQVDDVFCCLGTTMKVAKSEEQFRKVDFDFPHIAAQLAKKMCARSFILNSSVGANIRASSFYLKTKGELEEAIKNLQFNNFAVVRPSFLKGKREQTRLGEELAIKLLGPLQVMMQGPLKKYRPTDSLDVALAMFNLANKIPFQPKFEIEFFSA